ncbi:MAG: GNAT family N-acetyltransferase [Anaerolineales bacterium]|jgi:GNAT superfamily N-acetyltransferase
MPEFQQAVTNRDLDYVHELYTEYMHWVHLNLSKEYGIDFDVEEKVAQDMTELGMFMPPDGRLTLVTLESELVGLGCLRRIGEEVAEIKRMYLRPNFRGRGIGRELLEYLVEEAKLLGHKTIRLDSARFMDVAHSLYRSFGFKDIEPYSESEIPEEIREHWVFMEKNVPD